MGGCAMTNIGNLDRLSRLAAGIGLLAIYASSGILSVLGGWRHVAPATGFVMIATALSGFRPAYRLHGIGICGTGRF
jgi:hypothetical protein